MKKIGLLGGMSWESTAAYYRLINREVGRRLVDPEGPSPVPLFPTTRLHALAAVEFALAP